jgi:hypothetical protein
MSSQITLNLPDHILQKAELWAKRSGRPVADLLAESIELSMRPLGSPDNEESLPTSWTDQEVLAIADLEMAVGDDKRLSELLDRQKAGTLANGEQPELAGLMELYQRGLLRKAQALREAVRRGLREPLKP